MIRCAMLAFVSCCGWQAGSPALIEKTEQAADAAAAAPAGSGEEITTGGGEDRCERNNNA
jgi:hypothetical protein